MFFHCKLQLEGLFFAVGGTLAFRWSSSEVVRHSYFSRGQTICTCMDLLQIYCGSTAATTTGANQNDLLIPTWRSSQLATATKHMFLLVQYGNS